MQQQRRGNRTTGGHHGFHKIPREYKRETVPFSLVHSHLLDAQMCFGQGYHELIGNGRRPQNGLCFARYQKRDTRDPRFATTGTNHLGRIERQL